MNAELEVYDSGVTAEAMESLTGTFMRDQPQPTRAQRRAEAKSMRAKVRYYHRLTSGEMDAAVEKRRNKKKSGNAARRRQRVQARD